MQVLWEKEGLCVGDMATICEAGDKTLFAIRENCTTLFVVLWAESASRLVVIPWNSRVTAST